ncbi:Tellurite resistance protein [Shimia sagamensis]|uniref:Tellurite resistance protein n=2 Tax=Shimia sagamensis TaxID=1566352 RepID=A0ABY1P303_9RHOB|nr:Tellurite resistance protein [Shimia sagamensis]
MPSASLHKTIRRFLLLLAGSVNILHRNKVISKEFPVPDKTPTTLTPQDCLVAVMIAVSASDENIRTAELVKIQVAVNNLPVFAEYDIDRMQHVSQLVFELFEQEDGLAALFGLVRHDLPQHLFETAYALACDVAAADGTLAESELRILEEIRYELEIDRLHAAGIERGARARHMV